MYLRVLFVFPIISAQIDNVTALYDQKSCVSVVSGI